MTARSGREGWAPNANETGAVTGFNMGVAGVGAVGSAGWAGLRAVARRLGLPVAGAQRPTPSAVVGAACARCGGPVLVGEAACAACGRTAPPPAASAPLADLAASASRRRRRELVLALAVGVVVGVGILAIARTMERGHVQTLALQLWWLAGLFWGAFVLLTRSWLDQ